MRERDIGTEGEKRENVSQTDRDKILRETDKERDHF